MAVTAVTRIDAAKQGGSGCPSEISQAGLDIEKGNQGNQGAKNGCNELIELENSGLRRKVI